MFTLVYGPGEILDMRGEKLDVGDVADARTDGFYYCKDCGREITDGEDFYVHFWLNEKSREDVFWKVVSNKRPLFSCQECNYIFKELVDNANGEFVRSAFLWKAVKYAFMDSMRSYSIDKFLSRIPELNISEAALKNFTRAVDEATSIFILDELDEEILDKDRLDMSVELEKVYNFMEKFEKDCWSLENVQE
jgi:hypothetical protein